MAIFDFFSAKKATNSSVKINSIRPPNGWQKAIPGKTLLQAKNRQLILRKIQRELSITDVIWEHCYLELFENWASFVQLLPASENNHHSYLGGLLDHTLECALYALRLRRGYILPANEAVENISLNSDRYTYGVCVASLLHDCGKLLLDLNVVYGEPCKHQAWVPWTGPLASNTLYAFRYRQERPLEQHEIAGSSLLPVIMPEIGLSWINEDKELVVLLLAQLTGKEAQAGAIGEIVRSADKESVSKSLKGGQKIIQEPEIERPKVATAIHDQLLMAIRYLFHEGILHINRPSAAGWLVDGRAWLVSETVVEAAVSHLSTEGVTSIPKNVARVFEILLEHGLVMPSEDGKSVWKCKIHDEDKDWHQELTMLCFDQDIIWPSEKPEKFNGTVTPISKEKPKKEDHLDNKDDAIDKFVGKHSTVTKENEHAINNDQPSTIASNSPALPQKEKEKKSTPSKTTSSSEIGQRFINWVIKEVESENIIANDKGACIHLVDGQVLLVSPTVFKRYMKENPAAAVTLSTSPGKDDIRKLQHQFQLLGLHEKCNGINIREFVLLGTTLRGYLIKDPGKIFKNKVPNDNPHIQILAPA